MKNPSADRLEPSSEAEGLVATLKSVAIVGLIIAVAVGVMSGRTAAISAAYGALIAFGNLLVLGRMVRVFLARGGLATPWVVAALLKLAVLLLAMYLPMRAGVLELLPFVFGFGALPIGIVVGQFFSVPKSSKAN
jgi:hypothetical protein